MLPTLSVIWSTQFLGAGDVVLKKNGPVFMEKPKWSLERSGQIQKHGQPRKPGLL